MFVDITTVLFNDAPNRCRSLDSESLRTSDSTMPSRSRTTRRAQAAMSFSCVTMMIVLPPRFSWPSNSMILVARSAIEVAGRFVGKDHLRVVDERAGDGDPLLLTSGQLIRPVIEPLAEADQVGQSDTSVPRRRRHAGSALIQQRNLNVFDDQCTAAAGCTTER